MKAKGFGSAVLEMRSPVNLQSPLGTTPASPMVTPAARRLPRRQGSLPPQPHYHVACSRDAHRQTAPRLPSPNRHPARHMLHNLTPFLIHWAITAFSLWVASHIFRGLKFDTTGALVVSALLLGLANAVVKPLLIVLTLPLTLVTFGLFLLVINALMILLVAALVKGFRVSGFWTALFASIFISLLSIVIGSFVTSDDPAEKVQMPQSGNWL